MSEIQFPDLLAELSLRNKTKQNGRDFIVSFNQDASAFSVAYKNKCSVFNWSNIDEDIHVLFSRTTSGDIILSEMIYNTKMIALVDEYCPSRFYIYHGRSANPRNNVNTEDAILGIKVNWEHIVLCQRSTIYVRKMTDMVIVHKIENSFPNPEGLFALSNEVTQFLAFPELPGEVKIFDIFQGVHKGTIKAHQNQLAALAFNPCGDRLATTAFNELDVRIFLVVNGSLLWQNRLENFFITELSFSSCSDHLICSSSRETILFKFVNHFFEKPPQPAPRDINPMELKRTCAMTRTFNDLRFLIATDDGNLRVYAMPDSLAGKCPSINVYCLYSSERTLSGDECNEDY